MRALTYGGKHVAKGDTALRLRERERRRASLGMSETVYGKIANTLAGKPEPPFGFGKVTTTIAPASGT